jgi:adenine-specific DNA methylase
MNQNNRNSEEDSPKPLKIEGPLPSTATGIESIKESYSDSMSPHRRIFKWFARRPTTTTRLATLASILPPETSNNELLKLMCVGPKAEIEGDLEDYVIRKEATKDSRDGTVEEHFGYEYPHRRTPSDSELSEFHKEIKNHWNGELPTVLDPTAGGGTIPFESARYGLPTVSNELNPVAWLLNKVILEYARTVGSLESDVKRWAQKIDDIVHNEISEFFPSRNGVEASYYFRTYSISCPSCGEQFPLATRWWFDKNKDIAIKPEYDNNNPSYRIVQVSEEPSFDPDDGTISGGDAECPHCGVVTERDTVVERFQAGEYDLEVCGIKYVDKINGSKYHSPTKTDIEAIEASEEYVDNDLRLSTFLREDRYIGYYDRAGPYGVTQWRDLFTSRQLLSHVAYLDAFKEVEQEIKSEYDEETSEAILVLLTLIGSRQINHNSRLAPIRAQFGFVDNMLGNNNFSFQWIFGESNMLAGGKSYQSWTENVLEYYEKVVDYYPDSVRGDRNEVQLHQGDAGDLPLDSDSVQAVIIDPPYGDNIIYSEISDAFYVWQRQYLSDIFPEKFSKSETNKHDEAVENPALNPQSGSNEKPARQRYEDKMRNIFTEAFRVLESGGVITIYFTDKEIGAWDSLTMSIMDSGFTITATHTISSESPSRIGVQGQSSADSSLLLTCRKPQYPEEASKQPTLWSDIRDRTRSAAREKATELLDSNLKLTKTDVIIGAFGPTLRVFTEEYPVVDMHDNPVRPKQALEEARTAVTEVLIERELEDGLNDVDNLTRWYILSWLVYENESIPYDEARQLGLGVGVQIDDIKQDTKIWGKSGDTLVLKGQDYRVRDYDALEAGEKRRKRAYPVDPRENSFNNHIDAVHAALNVLNAKGGDFTWNWLQERDLQNSTWFKKTIKSLLQVLPSNHADYDLMVNLLSGETGELLDIEIGALRETSEEETDKTTLRDF